VRSLATFLLFARVRILVDSRRIMGLPLNAAVPWLRFIVSLCDTIDCRAFFVIGNSVGISYYKMQTGCLI
jgi:hypothetical protein